MADKSGTIKSSSYSIARTDVYWEATAGTGGCTVKATLKAVNTGGYYLNMTNYGTAYLTIDGEKKTTTGNAYSASSNGTANFLTFSKWISYTGNKNITIEGYIPANYMTNGTKVSDSKASATIALPKVGSAPTLTKITAPTTQVISETTSTITVTWEKATSYNNSCTYGIGVSINGGAYSWVYPDNNIDTTSYTYTVSNKTQGTTYKFAVIAANDVAQSNTIESDTVTLNKLEPPTIDTLNTYNPYVASSLSVPLSGGSQLNGSTFYRCAALYYGDEQLVVVVPTSKNNTSVSLTYSTDNYLTKLGKTKYSDTFKVVAWSQNDNGSKSSLVTQTFTVNINTDDGATPTLEAPTLSGGALSNPNTCFIKGISTLTITSATGAARRAPSGVTLSYSIRVSGSYSQGGQSASWSDLSAGTKTITVTCTDSRGLSTSVTKQCVIQDYSPPTIKSMSVARLSDPNTSAKATYELYYSPIYQYTDVNTKGNQLNGINSQQYRLNGGAWGNYTSGTAITGLSVDSTYKFELRCADKVRTSTYTTSSVYTIYTISHELSLRKGRLGIMCVPQSGYALDVKGKARFTNGIESSVNTSTYLNGSKGTNVLVNSTATGADYKTFLSGASTNGRFSLSMYQDRVMVGYQAQSSIDEGTNALTKYINLLNESGNTSLNGLSANSLSVSGASTLNGSLEVGGLTKINNTLKANCLKTSDEVSTSINAFYNSHELRFFTIHKGSGGAPGDATVLQLSWSGKWDTQLALGWLNDDIYKNALYYRVGNGTSWNDWETALSTANYKDLTAFTYSTSEQWTGKYDHNGRKIYSMYLGEMNVGTSTGTFTKAKTFASALKDCWIDDSMTYFAIQNGTTWEYRKLNNPTSGTNSKYVSEAWIVKSEDGKTATFKYYFGTNRTGHKYVHPYILYTYE